MSAEFTEARRENLEDVWRLYRIDALLAALTPVLTLAPATRDELLRDHRIRPVRNSDEIRIRDTLDSLLHACSLLEVGFECGALADPELRCCGTLAPLLRLQEVRDYYDQRYPLTLPLRLLQRIDAKNLVPESDFQASWFAELLNLDASFRNDQLRTFLRIVDGFRYNRVNGGVRNTDIDFESLEALVRSPDLLILSVMQPLETSSRTQQALVGLERFLLFCGDLRQLLDSAQEPVLADGVFHLYRYWFAERRGALAHVVDDALAALTAKGTNLSLNDLPERAALESLFNRVKADSHQITRTVVRPRERSSRKVEIKRVSNSHARTFVIDLAAEIVAAYLASNTIAMADLPGLILGVHTALTSESPSQDAMKAVPKEPAVPVRHSITPDYLVCLEDGRKFKSLKRHLRTKYNMRPEEYRAKWGLSKDYPMVAPNYARARSDLAKQMGLGQGGHQTAIAAKRR